MSDDIDVALVKTRILVLLFKVELPEATSSSMLTHRTNTRDHEPRDNEANKYSGLHKFHEAFCKTQVHPNDLTK